MKLKVYSYLLFLYLIILIFFWKIGISFNFTIFFIISTFIGLYLSRYNNKYIKIIVIFIGLLNFFLFVYAIIPQPHTDIDIKEFFLEQQNCLKVLKNDSDEILKKQLATVYILGHDKKIIYRLWEIENLTKICGLGTGYKIVYTARTKDLKTFLALYLWDGTIIRIFPKTKLVLDKVLRDVNNLPNSQTKISITEGDIRFRVVKLIINDKGFNIKTPDGILIIRGTAGFVSRTDKTLIYSDDHLIEGRNLVGDKFYVKGKEAVIFTKDKILKKLNFIQFLNYVGDDVYNILKNFKINDLKDIKIYKQKFINYIKNKIDIWQQSNIMMKLSLLKAKFNKKFLKGNALNTIEKVKILIGNFDQQELSKLDLTEFKNYIFIPTNDKYQKLKMKFFEQMSKLNNYRQKNYIIQKINNMLDLKKKDVDEYIRNLLQK